MIGKGLILAAYIQLQPLLINFILGVTLSALGFHCQIIVFIIYSLIELFLRFKA